jgi:DNA ligase-associated metallophosphoesterase
MKAPIAHKILGQTFWLHAQRAIFWEGQKALVLSDLHFGKTGHFRKAGIPVPQQVYKEDLQRLVELIQYFNPDQIIAVGDLFHSHANLELDLFKRWRLDFAQIPFHLVRGNHDILHNRLYQEMELTLWPERMQIDDIVFSHEQCNVSPGLFSFCGHMHPGIAINGVGRQSLRLSCFYFTPSYCILPAFSKFTGLAMIQPKAGDRIFAIAEQSVIPV